MKKLNFFFLAAFATVLTFTSCGSDDDTTTDTNTDLTLNISGLEDLGPDYTYEGWIMVDGAPKTTGTFDVDSDGNLTSSTFQINAEDGDAATAFILTIEPKPDADPAPSDVHIIAGDISSKTGTLTVGHSAALGSDFATAAGKYILATPSDGPDTNEASGLWFLDNSSGSPEAALELPELPAGWKYEGWAVVDGTPVSTGTFLTASGADDAAPYSGPEGVPPYPGEDLLLNAPAGLTFPTDMIATAVISIEPSPDNSAAPFVLKPLVGAIPAGADVHVPYDMNNNASATNPTGSVTIQ